MTRSFAVLLCVAVLFASKSLPADQAGATGASPYTQQQWAQFYWSNWYAFNVMAPWVDSVTEFGFMDQMMKAMDPQLMFGAQPDSYVDEAGQGVVPEELPLVSVPGFPTQSRQEWTPNTVTGDISREAKRNFYQTMMMMSPISMRDMIGIMAEKMPVAEDVSFDDAVDSMKLRANEINFKFVGHSPLWRDVRAITGDENTPRVEIFQFCDAVLARKILDYVPEFVVFLPCRVALLEDAHGKLWVMTLDWDVSWLNYAQNPNSILDRDLRAEATRIREGIRYIMEGAATGDF